MRDRHRSDRDEEHQAPPYGIGPEGIAAVRFGDPLHQAEAQRGEEEDRGDVPDAEVPPAPDDDLGVRIDEPAHQVGAIEVADRHRLQSSDQDEGEEGEVMVGDIQPKGGTPPTGSSYGTALPNTDIIKSAFLVKIAAPAAPVDVTDKAAITADNQVTLSGITAANASSAYLFVLFDQQDKMGAKN